VSPIVSKRSDYRRIREQRTGRLKPCFPARSESMKSGMTQDHDVVDEVAASHLAFQEP